MVVGLVLLGIVTGLVAAVTSLFLGYSILVAFVIYAATGSAVLMLTIAAHALMAEGRRLVLSAGLRLGGAQNL